MAGERFLFAPVEVDGTRLAEAIDAVVPGIETEVFDDEPGTYDHYPVMAVYWGEVDPDDMASRLRDQTGWDIRTERELEALTLAGSSAEEAEAAAAVAAAQAQSAVAA